MNKSFITNLLASSLMLIGYFIGNNILLNVGLFAFSGALTNWLAVHMLFEKVPLLYGSGVIPARFNEFKFAIKSMMMEQFFTDDNIDNFLSNSNQPMSQINLSGVIKKVDLSPAFDRLVLVIKDSSFGGMLGMLGGEAALQPLREPFIDNMQSELIEMTQSETFSNLLKTEIEQPEVLAEIKQKISAIIDKRLEELTPQMVKQIVQQMIKQHLGWLVVWGGVFGGIIGLASGFVLN